MARPASVPARPALGLPALTVLALLAIAWVVGASLPVSAYDEADAGLLRPDVLEARHEPVLVPAHAQWHGILVLRPGHAVLSAQYQICRVGEACFAPPAPATRQDNDTFTFDTRSYLAGGHPVDYQAGWRLGVQWLLTERTTDNGTRVEAFPAGPDAADPACAGDAQSVACQERHYLAFDMAPAAHAGAPALGTPALLCLVVVVALVASRRRTRHDG